MGHFRALKWGKFSLYLSGGGLAGFFGFVALVDPKRAVAWIGFGSAIVSLAGAIGALLPSQAIAVQEGAIEVNAAGKPTGAVVTTGPKP